MLPWVPENSFFLSILMVSGEAALTRPRRQKITSGHRSTQPHFHVRNQFRIWTGSPIGYYLAEIEYNPSLFEEFFVHQGGLSDDFVLNCLHFQDSCKQNVIDDRVYQMLQTFVKNLSVDELKNFLKFVTGTSEVSMSTLPHRISVSSYNGDSILPQHVYLN